MFLPVQLAAAKALSLGREWYEDLNATYRERRKYVYALLDSLQAIYDPKQSGMFVWASIPGTYEDGFAMSDDILQRAAVFITPGGIFGTEGKKYIRVSLCSTVEKLLDATERIEVAFGN